KCNNPPGRTCLYYHMDQCLACGDNPPSEAPYKKIIKQITSFLHGLHKSIKNQLKENMQRESEEHNFERTKELRIHTQHIEIDMQRQQVTLIERNDRDVFGYSYDKGWMCIQVFFIRQRKLI